LFYQQIYCIAIYADKHIIYEMLYLLIGIKRTIAQPQKRPDIHLTSTWVHPRRTPGGCQVAIRKGMSFLKGKEENRKKSDFRWCRDN
jgi:hypothetical protein